MKKSLLLALGGVMLAFFMVSAFGNRERLYEKKENFKTPEEVIANFIGYINTYENVKTDNGYYNVPSREFLESISERYRLYVGEKGWGKYINESIPIIFRYELEEVQYDSLSSIKTNYEDSFKNIGKYNRDNNPRVFRLDGYGSHNLNIEKYDVNEDGTVENDFNDIEMPITIYLFVVDEGEGYVIDYYTSVYQ